MSDIPLLILAGGRASRLGDLSDDCPKFLMPVGATGERFADVQLAWARLQGFKRVVLCVGYLADQIRSYCGDGSRYGLEISYSEDGEKPLGTGGALRKAATSLSDSLVAMIYGDTILSLDVPRICHEARTMNEDVVMTIMENPPPGNPLNARLNFDGTVTYDKRSPGADFKHIDYGFLVIKRHWLMQWPLGEAIDLADRIQLSSKNGHVRASVASIPFWEIGTRSSLNVFAQSRPKGLIILDRDGVLNELIVDQEHGLIDSPLNEDQVRVFSWVPEVLADWCREGWGLAIATNQPASAKGKTTLVNLERVHQKVLAVAQSAGAKILSSHICFKTSDDPTNRRKPKPDLLWEALRTNAVYGLGRRWMIGDGVTDVEAGEKAGCATVFLGPRKCDACKVFDDRGYEPVIWAKNLRDAADKLRLSAERKACKSPTLGI